MLDTQDNAPKAFASFRVLTGDGSGVERDQLFRNMAQLFSYMSSRCDDDQVAQYDEVLCQLAELVEINARIHVAKMLSALERAPGTVVLKLANDDIEVARPLLEFSSVLSDDDLIDIVHNRTEDHRVAIAGRNAVAGRVGEAIAEAGGRESIARLMNNPGAELDAVTMEKVLARATESPVLADDLRGRTDIDWKALREEIGAAGQRTLERLGLVERMPQDNTIGRVSAVVYNRLRNRAGFNADEWKVAWNQVKALNDRNLLDTRALARFARFGYGHHAAAALTVLLGIAPDVLVKWLAGQDYVAATVAFRALGIEPDLFEATVAVMPWRDMPDEQDRRHVRARFEALSREEAQEIFQLWRAHAFRRRAAAG